MVIKFSFGYLSYLTKYALYTNGDLVFRVAFKLKVEFLGRVNSFSSHAYTRIHGGLARRRAASDRLGKEAHASCSRLHHHLHHPSIVGTIICTIIRPSLAPAGGGGPWQIGKRRALADWQAGKQPAGEEACTGKRAQAQLARVMTFEFELLCPLSY